MATAFLELVSKYIFENHKDKIDSLCIVLPNKRASLFLKQHLAKTFQKTIWLPHIISAEEFYNELSGLQPLEDIDLICHLFESYKFCYGEASETFESFTKWGQLILQDFNEIDAYSVDANQLYGNLKDIKEIENWSLGAEELTEHQQNYLKFMNSLSAIYNHFNDFLIKNNWAYKGLVYKKALANIQTNRFTGQFHKIIFAGFNALNAVELKIIGQLYNENTAELIWDADEYYIGNPDQEAGMFLRKNFELFGRSKNNFIQNNFKNKKNIEVVSVPKQIGQAQVVKQKLQHFINNKIPLDKVAVVLANEKLLWPVLQQLPEAVEHVNITMEYPIKYTTTYSLLDSLLEIQIAFSKQNANKKSLYYKSFVQLLREPLFNTYLQASSIHLNPLKIIQEIKKRNLNFIPPAAIKEFTGDHFEFLFPLLQPLTSVKIYCEAIIQMLHSLTDHFSEQRNDQHGKLELEYLQITSVAYNRLNALISQYPYFNDLASYKQIFNLIIGNTKASFLGEPLKGLQIMGLLESRTLDFEHVILVNVNEGILPSGKSINSFIPNDLKRAHALPLYVEKDAIYAYHFYRLIQRANEITITYDSETDSFGKGEKSRLVTQLQLELTKYNPEIEITERVARPEAVFTNATHSILIQKTEAVLDKILKKAKSNEQYQGLSPSSLIAYKDCSLRFYFRYGVLLRETEEVEETAEANTFGSILHLSLENFYKDELNKPLEKTKLQSKLLTLDTLVNKSFISFFDQKELQGKSILQEEVIKSYVKKQVQQDIEHVEKLGLNNHFLTLIHLEQEFSASCFIQLNGQKTEIFIKGKIDRIDRFENKVRVIDYKSSIKASDKFKFEGFEKLFSDKNYNKQLQLFIYAWLLYKNKFCEPEALSPCIIAFRDFKPEPRFIESNKNELVFNENLFELFEAEVVRFIGSILDERVPFAQTEDEDLCTYCTYKVICNRGD